MYERDNLKEVSSGIHYKVRALKKSANLKTTVLWACVIGQMMVPLARRGNNDFSALQF